MMLWRIAARALTGPIAFFLAGAIDIGAFGFVAWRARRRERRRAA